jgi:hypothetical protein
MTDSIKELLHQSNNEVVQLSAKTGVGLVGSLTAMSVNDWAGLIVAILTGIYMCFQIESAWRNRKAAKQHQQNAKNAQEASK